MGHRERVLIRHYGGGWYAIRQANIGLEALQKGLLKDATQEERNFIEGQLYFSVLGSTSSLQPIGVVYLYIESVLASDAQFNLPRESYQENAEKMAADFQLLLTYYQLTGTIPLQVVVRKETTLSVLIRFGHSHI
ncbi:MAG: hypothetical protein R2738_08275 [Bacteroides graminisolvens]